MITRTTFADTLRAVGIGAGEIVHVQSNLRRVGRVEGANDAAGFLKFYLQGLLDVIGPEGTISVHVPFLDYGRYGTPFIVEESPSEAGAFSEFIRKLPGRRSLVRIPFCLPRHPRH